MRGRARLVLFSGPPGVGKSSLSYRLARHTGWAVLRKDRFDRTLETHGPPGTPPTLAYELMLDAAELNLQSQVSVILDACFPKAGFRERARAMAERWGSAFRPMVCTCDDPVLWRQRLESRPEMVAGWTPADWAEAQRVQAYFEPWHLPHLTLDAARPFDENFDQLLRWVYSEAEEH